MFRKIGGKLKNFANDKRGQIAIMAMVLIILLAGGFFLMTWMVLSNLETIGKGILYLAVAVLVMVGVAILAKRYLFGKEVVG